MNSIRAAFYARVSSEQQATAHTIESQLAALSERAQADGLPVPLERQFVDDGYSGATLVRPAMDRLRDLAAVSGVDRIYVHSPDRLARNYAYCRFVNSNANPQMATVVWLSNLSFRIIRLAWGYEGHGRKSCNL